MSYRYVEFDGVALPLFNHTQEHDPMRIESTLLPSVGSAFDWWGSGKRQGRTQIIVLSGVYAGDAQYLVDETGDFLVDETGDFLLAGSAIEMLYSDVQALSAKMGDSGSLWRLRVPDQALEWKRVRFLNEPWRRGWEDHALLANLSCHFESSMQYWHAETPASASGSAAAAVPFMLLVENSAMPIDDAVVTITRTSGTITSLSLTCAELGIGLLWSGVLGSGDVLVIDAGAKTVIKNGESDAYSGFALSGHTARGWISIPAGQYPFVATVVGGNATVAISYYLQFP